ncbi:MAG: DUF2997 domain-containing protein [Clostridia bacterium]|nr:DUF2997 domain-containing protein [Clostridia bacterium]
MSQKQIIIRIGKDGTIKAETKNIKGKKCLGYLTAVEALTQARTVDSEFTSEYYEQTEFIQTTQNDTVKTEVN